MYYHIKISTNSGHYLTELKTDLSKEQLNDRFLSRIKVQKNLTINGRSVKFSEIVRVQIYQSEENTNYLINDMKLHGGWEFNDDEVCRDIAVKDSKEITDDILIFPDEITEEKLIKKSTKGRSESQSKVFIVHGHDKELKNEVEAFLYSIKLKPIILHRQTDEGQTIIEKFEKNSDVTYAVILFTPDDNFMSNKKINLKDFNPASGLFEKRARQNVIFEFGYFVGKLGRKNVCCLYKEDAKLPTDINGLIYKNVSKGLESKKLELIQEFKAAGLKLVL